MINLRFYLLFLKEWSELLVEFLTIGETTVDEAYTIYFGTDAEFLIRKTINVLKELVLDTVLLDSYSCHIFVATLEWNLELHGEACNHGICSLFVKFSKTDIVGEKELVTCMFEIMLVVGVVYNTLKIALIVAHLVL